MNSRRRRGVVLLTVSLLCALVAFGGVLALIRGVESKVGPESAAYELKEDVPAHRPLRAGDLTRISLPERYLPATAVTDLDDLRGTVTVNKLRKGSVLQRDMVAERPALEPGQQEIAIMIDAETGVAGKITPGSEVNIFATFEGDDARKGAGDTSRIIVSGARVVDVGRLTPFRKGDDEDRRRETDGVPLTFALSAADAQRVTYAESFAKHVRLALVAPGDDTPIPDGDRTYTLSGDK